ncbi:MAG: hypothetical protein ACREIP_03880 [Alphaproteobacteria bacterium]
MPTKLLLLAAGAALALSSATAQAAEAPLDSVRNKIVTGPTTPQVAYPPICRWDPVFPKYCRRW